ncbi:NAD(P)-binding domain-containing protein [Candidatus Nomurabacteria bacterium]|nr:NAD(P)-binding domain-containing protein [Candidatus Nomurabacteria bacterium]
MKSIGIIGSGIVGVTLANGLSEAGYSVCIGSNTKPTVEGWNGTVGLFKNVAKESDIVILSVKGTSAEDVVRDLSEVLAGKTVIDTTNPISDSPPEDGVIEYFTDTNDSLMERLQKAAPKADFVKSFNSVGSAVMVQPKFSAGKPTMFICGNNAVSKVEVSNILDKLGWESKDLGGVKSARAIEPLCRLWCIPGFLDNKWDHAFKFLS